MSFIVSDPLVGNGTTSNGRCWIVVPFRGEVEVRQTRPNHFSRLQYIAGRGICRVVDMNRDGSKYSLQGISPGRCTILDAVRDGVVPPIDFYERHRGFELECYVLKKQWISVAFLYANSGRIATTRTPDNLDNIVNRVNLIFKQALVELEVCGEAEIPVRGIRGRTLYVADKIEDSPNARAANRAVRQARNDDDLMKAANVCVLFVRDIGEIRSNYTRENPRTDTQAITYEEKI